MADVEADLKLTTANAKAAADAFARDVGSKGIVAPLSAPAGGTTSAQHQGPGVSPELADFASGRAMKRGGVSGADILSIANQPGINPSVRSAMMAQLGGVSGGGSGGDIKEAAGELASAVRAAASEVRRAASNPLDDMPASWRYGSSGGGDGGGYVPPTSGGAGGGGEDRGRGSVGGIRGFARVFGGQTGRLFTSVGAFGRFGAGGGIVGTAVAFAVGGANVHNAQAAPWAQFTESDDILEQMNARQGIIRGEKYSPERLFGLADIAAGLGWGGQSNEEMVAGIQTEEKQERRRRSLRTSEIALQAATTRRMGYVNGGEYGAGRAGIRADYETRRGALSLELSSIPSTRDDLRQQKQRELASNAADFSVADRQYTQRDELSRQSQRNQYLNDYTGASNATTATRANAYDRPIALMQAELDTARSVHQRARGQLRSTMASAYGGMMSSMAGPILNAAASADNAQENYLQARNDAALSDRSSDERFRKTSYSAQQEEAESASRGMSRPRAAWQRMERENYAEERHAREQGLPWAGAMSMAHRAIEQSRQGDIVSDERLSAGSIDFGNESLRILSDPSKGSFQSRQRQAESNTIIRDTQMRAAKAYQEGRGDQVPRLFEQGRLQVALQQQQYLAGFQSQEVNLNRIAPQDNAANTLNAMAKAAENLKNVPTKDDLVKIIDDAIKKIDQTR